MSARNGFSIFTLLAGDACAEVDTRVGCSRSFPDFARNRAAQGQPIYHLLGPIPDADKRLGPVAPGDAYIGLRFETDFSNSGVSGTCARAETWKRVANAALKRR